METRQEDAGLVKILVVDDDPSFLREFQKAAESEPKLSDCKFIYASDGNEAVAKHEQEKPQVVVLDQMLPKRSGFLVLEKMKIGKNQADPPYVIMVTGNLGARHKMYAEKLGVCAYFTKAYANNLETELGLSHSSSWMNKVLEKVVASVENYRNRDKV